MIPMSQTTSFTAKFDDHYNYIHANSMKQDIASRAIDNANQLAIMLQTNITIHKGYPSKGIPSAICDLLLNPHYLYCEHNRKREGSTYFGKDSQTNPIASIRRKSQFAKLTDEIKSPISLHFLDHPTYVTLRGKSKKTIAVGWSPYVNPHLIENGNAAETVREVTEQFADLAFPGDAPSMEPSWRDLYDLLVLNPNETYYYPGSSVTILFVNKHATKH